VNEPYAENVFGRFATGTFAKLLGSPDGRPARRAAARPGARLRLRPVYDKDGSEEDKKTFRAKQKQLLEAGRADLLKFAEELGVTLH
jgi:hypothetical protein